MELWEVSMDVLELRDEHLRAEYATLLAKNLDGVLLMVNLKRSTKSAAAADAWMTWLREICRPRLAGHEVLAEGNPSGPSCFLIAHQADTLYERVLGSDAHARDGNDDESSGFQWMDDSVTPLLPRNLNQLLVVHKLKGWYFTSALHGMCIKGFDLLLYPLLLTVDICVAVSIGDTIRVLRNAFVHMMRATMLDVPRFKAYVVKQSRRRRHLYPRERRAAWVNTDMAARRERGSDSEGERGNDHRSRQQALMALPDRPVAPLTAQPAALEAVLLDPARWYEMHALAAAMTGGWPADEPAPDSQGQGSRVGDWGHESELVFAEFHDEEQALGTVIVPHSALANMPNTRLADPIIADPHSRAVGWGDVESDDEAAVSGSGGGHSRPARIRAVRRAKSMLVAPSEGLPLQGGDVDQATPPGSPSTEGSPGGGMTRTMSHVSQSIATSVRSPRVGMPPLTTDESGPTMTGGVGCRFATSGDSALEHPLLEGPLQMMSVQRPAFAKAWAQAEQATRSTPVMQAAEAPSVFTDSTEDFSGWRSDEDRGSTGGVASEAPLLAFGYLEGVSGEGTDWAYCRFPVISHPFRARTEVDAQEQEATLRRWHRLFFKHVKGIVRRLHKGGERSHWTSLSPMEATEMYAHMRADAVRVSQQMAALSDLKLHARATRLEGVRCTCVGLESSWLDRISMWV